MKTLEDVIRDQEGLKLRIYSDSQGIWTIGYGRNLEDIGISQAEALVLMKNDCDRARGEANTFQWYTDLNSVRQIVIESMVFNMGLARFSLFKKMIAALGVGDYETAAEEMRNSVWAKQVKSRADVLSQWMKTGVFQE